MTPFAWRMVAYALEGLAMAFVIGIIADIIEGKFWDRLRGRL